MVPARSQAHRQGRGKGHWLSCSVDDSPSTAPILAWQSCCRPFLAPSRSGPQAGRLSGFCQEKRTPVSIFDYVFKVTFFFQFLFICQYSPNYLRFLRKTLWWPIYWEHSFVFSVPPQVHSFTNIVIGISLCLGKEGGSSVCLRYCLELKVGLYFLWGHGIYRSCFAETCSGSFN